MTGHESKILVVDDQKANRLSCEFILEELNLDVYHACSGKEALSQILHHDFAVILMDVVMPNLDGYETTRLIRSTRRYQDVPIVMVTANDQVKEQYIKAYEAGAVDYISKPIEPIVLINKVKQFVELHRQKQAAQLSQLEQEKISSRMQGLLNSAGEGILGIELNGKITFANPKACELLRIEQVDLTNYCIQEFLYTKNKTSFDKLANKKTQDGSPNDIISLLRQDENLTFSKERWVTSAGNSFCVEYSCEVTTNNNGRNNGAVVTFQNVTERKIIEEKLIRLANYDPLTNLANRAYFHDSLTRAVARSRRMHGNLALMFLDLDHFKNINDSLGHDAGDLLLQVIGDRLIRCIRAGDIAARIGGDEFAIILHDIDSMAPIITVAKKIIKKVHQPIDLLGNSISTSVSIGIAVYDDPDMAMDELAKAADIAMYVAKGKGRNTFQFFEKEMQYKAEEKNRIQITLQHAMRNDELSVYYQPKISIADDKVVGMEALVRWRRQNTMISPAVFIPIAEETGQIHELGEWVFRQVCKQVKVWTDLPGFDELIVSVNVSAHQLKAGNFHEFVERALEDYDIEAKHLELELTETAIMGDPEMAARELQAIHDLGLQISIDDFGTGYSSLNYLKRFPIDVLKIDRCFVQDIGDDHHDEEIIKIVVAIAHTMGIHVIAEGVETKQQLAFLSSIGCDQVQGYFFSRPMDTEKTTDIIKNIQTSYESCFADFHTYMNEHNIQPLNGKTVH